MRKYLPVFLVAATLTIVLSCSKQKKNESIDPMNTVKIIFLHHSTGGNIWLGDRSTLKSVYQRKILKESAVTAWFKDHNEKNASDYQIVEQAFPKKVPYGWKNYPYDYYNIWVKNAGALPYQEEPTLEMLTRDYDVIIWKHCYPVGNILEDTGNPDINSEEKRIENYRLQYEALKRKMLEFPDTRFIVWTGAALVKSWTNEDEARRSRQFFDWVKSEWDDPDDNIYIWDLYELETEGGLFLNEDYAMTPNNPHPNNKFSGKAARLFCQRIVDVVENDGKKTSLTGELK
jgi:hypothetical protein